jgi:Alpha/beta hydrolase of unknown function (DUF900)
MTYFIDLRADSSGGNPVANAGSVVIRSNDEMYPVRSLDSELANAIQGRNVLLGTHGFHVNREGGIENLHHWNSWLLTNPDCFFVGVLWPGDSKWVPFIDYPIEGDEAIKSGKLLADYLVAKFSGAASLSFASHSLGARVMLETIRHLPGPPSSPRLVSLTMMAGAIDDTCLVNEYSDSVGKLTKVSVLASKEDEVLKLAFPAGNPVAGIVTRGEPYWHGAIGRYGPNPPSQPSQLYGSPILPDEWNFEHSSYINCTGQVTGPPGEAGSFPVPLIVPQPGAPIPVPSANSPVAPNQQDQWITNGQQAWAAGFVLTRLS